MTERYSDWAFMFLAVSMGSFLAAILGLLVYTVVITIGL